MRSCRSSRVPGHCPTPRSTSSCGSYLPADEIGKATLWAADLGGTHVLSLQALETGILHVQTGEGDVFDALTNEKVGMGPTLSLDLIANQVRVLKW